MIAIGAKVQVTDGPWAGRLGVVIALTEIGRRVPVLHLVQFETPDEQSGPVQFIADGALVEVQ